MAYPNQWLDFDVRIIDEYLREVSFYLEIPPCRSGSKPEGTSLPNPKKKGTAENTGPVRGGYHENPSGPHAVFKKGTGPVFPILPGEIQLLVKAGRNFREGFISCRKGRRPGLIDDRLKQDNRAIRHM
jgi:hypothetical protein